MKTSLILSLASCQTLDFSENAKKNSKIQELIETKIALVKTHLDKGQPSEAWPLLRPMLQAHPNHPAILNIAGLTYLALSKPEQALKMFRRAYEQDASAAIGLNLSSALIAENKFATARRLLKKLLPRATDYAYRERLWHNLALTHDKEGQHALAEKYYRKALDENPAYYLANLQLAHLYKRQGNSRNALTYYRKAAQYCKSCFAPRSELATFLIKAGHYDRAITLLGRFVKNKESPATEVKEANHLMGMAQGIKARQTRRTQ